MKECGMKADDADMKRRCANEPHLYVHVCPLAHLFSRYMQALTKVIAA